MKILTEASGSLTSGYIIDSIKKAGHIPIGSDINKENAAAYLSDDFIIFPDKNDKSLWEKVEKLIISHEVNVVIPSFDDMMLGWAQRKEYFKSKGINIIISPIETIKTFLNKWETYLFFIKNEIPCPKTSLTQDFALIKPIDGVGGRGISFNNNKIDMNGMISQEIAEGEEYTVDTFFDYLGNPIYIVPRKRIGVINGKSTKGIVVKNDIIEHYVKKIASKVVFIGPINFQCFINNDKINFIEINPRLAGGMALGFAATENWISLIVNNLIYKKPIIPKKIKYNLKMYRYYAEYFVS